MDRSQADSIIKELHALVIEQRRIADAMAGIIRTGSPFIDPNDHDELDAAISMRNANDPNRVFATHPESMHRRVDFDLDDEPLGGNDPRLQ